MKETVISIFGAVGGFVGYLVGGFDSALIVLAIFMLLDYVFGFIVAAVYNKSTKTANGAYCSSVALKGLIKKFGCFIIIIIAAQLDLLVHREVCRNIVTYALIANEGMSILENISITGIPVPDALKHALEVLKEENKDG